MNNLFKSFPAIRCKIFKQLLFLQALKRASLGAFLNPQKIVVSKKCFPLLSGAGKSDIVKHLKNSKTI